MKNQILTTGIFILSMSAFAQNTNPWPASGNVSIGQGNISPTLKLDIQTATQNDGIRVMTPATGSGASCLYLDNRNTRGRSYLLGSTGTANTTGAGHFLIWDMKSATHRFVIDTLGNTGIGISTPVDARLRVYKSEIPDRAHWGVRSQVYQSAANTMGHQAYTAVEGLASSNSVNEGEIVGVNGIALNGFTNKGGYFNASGGSLMSNYGVRTEAAYNQTNYGLYASAYGGSVNWAGYFQGDVNINGVAYCTNMMWGSDRKLKSNIKPLSEAIDKLMLLKPSTYNFKTEEFRSLNLPENEQIGLIAQELEEVFPTLVSEKPESVIPDSKGNNVTYAGHKTVNYIGLIPVLISGVQEQQALINNQNEQIAAQQKQIDELKAMVQALTGKPASNNDITSIPVNVSDNNTIVLNQNTPNPFAESTVISYNIPVDFTKAQVLFTDMRGTVIKSVDIAAKGKGALTVFADDLSHGVYTYSMIVDGKTIATRKMIKE